MSTLHTAEEEVTELLKLNTDDRNWCSNYVNRTVEVGVLSPEQGRSVWDDVFGAGAQPAPAGVVRHDPQDVQRSSAIPWVLIFGLFGLAALVLGAYAAANYFGVLSWLW
jgi:hypothetical protein